MNFDYIHITFVITIKVKNKNNKNNSTEETCALGHGLRGYL
jgi:hypothetical protein